MTTITADTRVVLWSPHQRQFHIETLGEMLDTNLRIYMEQKLGDYILLAMTTSSEEAVKIIDKLKEERAKPKGA